MKNQAYVNSIRSLSLSNATVESMLGLRKLTCISRVLPSYRVRLKLSILVSGALKSSKMLEMTWRLSTLSIVNYDVLFSTSILSSINMSLLKLIVSSPVDEIPPTDGISGLEFST